MHSAWRTKLERSAEDRVKTGFVDERVSELQAAAARAVPQHMAKMWLEVAPMALLMVGMLLVLISTTAAIFRVALVVTLTIGVMLTSACGTGRGSSGMRIAGYINTDIERSIE